MKSVFTLTVKQSVGQFHQLSISKDGIELCGLDAAKHTTRTIKQSWDELCPRFLCIVQEILRVVTPVETVLFQQSTRCANDMMCLSVGPKFEGVRFRTAVDSFLSKVGYPYINSGGALENNTLLCFEQRYRDQRGKNAQCCGTPIMCRCYECSYLVLYHMLTPSLYSHFARGSSSVLKLVIRYEQRYFFYLVGSMNCLYSSSDISGKDGKCFSKRAHFLSSGNKKKQSCPTG